MKKLSKKEIIEKVLANIKEKGRAINEIFGCDYKTESGNNCAVGLFMPSDSPHFGFNGTIDELCEENCDFETDFLDGKELYQRLDELVDEVLIEEARGHGFKFWNSMQDLHDGNSYWIGRKLSKVGQNQLGDIKSRFGIE